jgi:hypothetical protein
MNDEKPANGVANPPAMAEKTDIQSTTTEQTDPRVVILPPADKPWLRPWQPGQSGNPGGRPRNLGRLARALTGDGEDCARLWKRMMDGEEPGTEGKRGLRWRAWASQRLAERGFGKPTTPIDVHSRSEHVSVGVTLDVEILRKALGTLSTEELRWLHAVSTKLRLAQQQATATLAYDITATTAVREHEQEPAA